MPSSFSHAAAGIGAAAICFSLPMPRRYWVLAGIAGAIPDIDLIAWVTDTPYTSVWAHRGITHGCMFALVFGGIIAATAFRSEQWTQHRGRLWLAFSLAIASHGLLDGLATYGGPVQYLAPFTNRRFELPWHPIGGGRGPGPKGPLWNMLRIVSNELLWIWLPVLALAASAWLVRRRRDSGNRQRVS